MRGRLGLGARPPLAARLWGGQLGPVAHLLLAQGVGVRVPPVCGASGQACVRVACVVPVR